MSSRDDFYVGYAPRASRALSRWLRVVVGALFVLALVSAVFFVTRHSRFGAGAFEFGVEREIMGIVFERPVPSLVPLFPNDARQTSPTLLLVGFGKHGTANLIDGHHARPVRARGSLIHRDGRAMLELHALEPLKLEELVGLTMPGAGGADLGQVTLTGEVVDSKCFLGVMKPGHTKPHRACAARCISGGVPPLLLVLEPNGEARHVVLVSSAGEMINDEVLPYVAERVEINGTLRDHGGLEVLYADVSDYRRQPDFSP